MLIRCGGLALVVFGGVVTCGIAGCGSGELPATTETPHVEPEVIEQGIEKSKDFGNAKYMRGQRR